MWKVYKSRQLSTIIVLFLHPMLLYRIVPKEKQNFVHIFVFVFVKPEKTSKNDIIMSNFMQRRFVLRIFLSISRRHHPFMVAFLVSCNASCLNCLPELLPTPPPPRGALPQILPHMYCSRWHQRRKAGGWSRLSFLSFRWTLRLTLAGRLGAYVTSKTFNRYNSKTP
jgi:hypothetical protein